MKKILIFMCVVASNVAIACPSLDGKWISSLEKFDQFNKRWANVDTKAWSFMVQTQGHERIEYMGNKEMVVRSPEIELKIGENKMQRPSSEEHINFDILACTDKNIVMKYVRYGAVQISTLHFENKDTYWVYMGTADSDGNSHIREYYTRKNKRS
jgi:hypothetical protein